MTQIEQVRAEAKRLGWQQQDHLVMHTKFERYPHYIIVKQSEKGRVTRGKLLGPDGSEIVVTTNVFRQVLSWLGEEIDPGEDMSTPTALADALASEASEAAVKAFARYPHDQLQRLADEAAQLRTLIELTVDALRGVEVKP